MNKSYTLKIVILSFIAFFGFGQNSPVPQTTNQELRRPFLWTATSKSGQIVYLMGSIHIASKNVYPLPVAVDTAFDNSQAIAVEMNISPRQAGFNSLMFMKYGYYQDGEEPLRSRIPEDLYTRVKERANLYGMNMDLVNRMKPWLLSLAFSGLNRRDFSSSSVPGIDLFFIQRAEERDMPILELEGAEKQIQMFDQMRPAIQEKLLVESLAPKTQSETLLSSLEESYIRGDDETLVKKVLEPFQADPEGRELAVILFEKRNREMALKVYEYLNSGKRVFVVAGAGHFVGTKNVQFYLNQFGVTTKRSDPSPLPNTSESQ